MKFLTQAKSWLYSQLEMNDMDEEAYISEFRFLEIAPRGNCNARRLHKQRVGEVQHE